MPVVCIHILFIISILKVQQDTPEPDRISIHKESYVLLRPEIRKMKQFMDYIDQTVKLFGIQVQVCVSARQQV